MRKCKLGDLMHFHRGYDLPIAKMKSGKYPVIGSSGINGYHNEYTTEAPSLSIGRSGNSAGKPFIYYGKTWTHNTALYVENFYNCDPSYGYYLLKSLNLSDYRTGSAVPTLNRNHIHALDVIIPDTIEEQKKIAHILKTLDDKIKINNRLNTTLEAMAKTLYDYWFVQFDFPDEHGRPYKTSGGSMTYNEELGREIPTGWEVIPLKSIAEYNNNLKEVVLSENYIGIDNMLPNMKGVTSSTYDVPAGSIIGFEKRDILIGNIRPYFKKIWLADFNGGCSPDVLALHANIDSLTEFVYSSLANDTFFDYDTKGAKGTKMPRGDKAHIMSFPIAFNQKLAKKFSGIVQDMFIKKGQSVVENRYLTQLCDFLLPLLMNGQVTFK